MAEAPVMASYRLVKPKTMPRIAPPRGPSSMAPMAMGTMVSVITRGPTGILDRPVTRIMRMMAMKTAYSAMVRASKTGA